MIAKHRANPTCASCHAVMDPLGWRSRTSTPPAGGATGTGSPASRSTPPGTLPDGTAINGPDDLRKALLRRPEQFVQTFTEGLLSYATGRTLEYRDMPTVRRIVRGTRRAADYRLSAIVQGIVRSEQFRMRRAPQTGAGGRAESRRGRQSLAGSWWPGARQP